MNRDGPQTRRLREGFAAGFGAVRAIQGVGKGGSGGVGADAAEDASNAASAQFMSTVIQLEGDIFGRDQVDETSGIPINRRGIESTLEVSPKMMGDLIERCERLRMSISGKAGKLAGSTVTLIKDDAKTIYYKGKWQPVGDGKPPWKHQ